MAKAEIILGEGSGGIDGITKTFTTSEMQNCTDSTPITINGTFTGDAIIASGIYNDTAGYQDVGAEGKSGVTLGQTYQMNVGNHSGMQGWRKVTVYSDKVVVGSGGYDTTTNSNYGLMNILGVR